MNLILISSEAIRKKWVSQYHLIEKKLTKLKRDWNLFEDEAQTQYQKWYHQTFAERVSQLSKTSEEIHELRTTLSAVQAHIEVRKLSKKAAFAYVMEAIENKTDPFPAEAEIEAFRSDQKKAFYDEFKADHSRSGKEEIDPELLDRAREIVMATVHRQYPHPPENPIEAMLLAREIEEAIHETYERLKNNVDDRPYNGDKRDQEKPGFDSNFEHFFAADEEEDLGDSPQTNGDHRASEKSTRVLPIVEDYKIIYRKIVKRLHPDRGEEMSREEKSLWSETQKAYREKNAEALKTILLRAEGNGTIKIDQLPSIGEIIDIVYSLHEEVDEIAHEQKQSKKEWVYRFWASKSRKKNRDKLENEIQKQLGQQLAHSRYQLRDLRDEFNDLKKASLKKSKTTVRRR